MTVPWHQDNAYVSQDAWNNLTVVAWIPLVDVSQQNGCMQVLSGGHRSGQTARHTCCQGGTWYVEMDEEDARQKLGVDTQTDAVTCPMPAGSVLLMNAHSKLHPLLHSVQNLNVSAACARRKCHGEACAEQRKCCSMCGKAKTSLFFY